MSKSVNYEKLATDDTHEDAISVKAVVTVTTSAVGFFKSFRIDRGQDELQDLLGKSLLLELVAAQLDPRKLN